jgi:hypothetical protein
MKHPVLLIVLASAAIAAQSKPADQHAIVI